MGGTDTAATSIVVYGPLRITTTSLPSGIIGVPYSQTLTAEGGIRPILVDYWRQPANWPDTKQRNWRDIRHTEEVGSFDLPSR